MENKAIEKFKKMSEDMAFPLFVDDGEKWAANKGLTKLEYAVIHNMPELDEVNLYKNQYDDHLTNKDVAKIKKPSKPVATHWRR